MNYRMQVVQSFSAVKADDWNRLVTASPCPTPFMRHEFLDAAETSGSACRATGWQPLPLLLLNDQNELIAATPIYAKDHSYGEYVFDWAWARAYQQAGLTYYPKGLIAAPFSPVPGSHLLARDPQARRALAEALTQMSQDSGWSSTHLLFGDQNDQQALMQSGWLIRQGVQFHWHNPGYTDFEEFLGALSQPKRKKIRAERRKVAEAGVVCQVRRGPELTEADWDFFYRCYEQTYWEHGNPPYLNRTFFSRISQSMAEDLILVTATTHPASANRLAQASSVACALFFFQRSASLGSGGILYGRYWGSLYSIPFLHFELAYYTPIQWAIAQGIQRIEGGAQGEHKMARGFTPVETMSAHWLSDERFKEAVSRFLEREGLGINHYVDELNDRSPFREKAGDRNQTFESDPFKKNGES